MAVRRKRSISMPPQLDAEIDSAARAEAMTYSAWLAAAARKELLVRAGLGAVQEFERSHGPFSAAEIAQADEWARTALDRSKGSGTTRRRSA